MIKTWEELINKIKSSDNFEVWNNSDTYICISQRGNHYIKFCKNGDISIIFDYDEDELLIAEYRTPAQMYQIIEALR